MYFEAEKEDDLRKVGYSKERRVDPQIVVGLLVDRTGFPLEIGCYEGNPAETHTIVPIVRQVQARHDLDGVETVVAADAGMLSAANLAALDDAGLKFIVGSRVTKAPGDLASHFHWNGTVFTDGQVIDTITPRHGRSVVNNSRKRAEPVWNETDHPNAWRAVWQYSRSRAARDEKTLNAQEARARAVVDGIRTATMRSRSAAAAAGFHVRQALGAGIPHNTCARVRPPRRPDRQVGFRCAAGTSSADDREPHTAPAVPQFRGPAVPQSRAPDHSNSRRAEASSRSASSAYVPYPMPAHTSAPA